MTATWTQVADGGPIACPAPGEPALLDTPQIVLVIGCDLA